MIHSSVIPLLAELCGEEGRCGDEPGAQEAGSLAEHTHTRKKKTGKKRSDIWNLTVK